ncbi:MAG: DUF1572 domain-containing protein [Flavobacterium sp.]
MTSKQIAGRLREVLLNGTWVAYTNYKKELDEIDYTTANVEVNSLNSIAAIAQHIHYYIAGVLNVFNGGGLDIKDKYSFDFPPVASQEQWEIIRKKFYDDTEAYARHVERLNDEQLAATFVDEKYGSYYRNIEAMIEHSYYHLGQIVLIKKMLGKH